MPIIASAGDTKSYTPAPEGTHQAVCVDVIDRGNLKSAFLDDKGNEKWQHKIDIVWQIGETRDDGTRFLLNKRYTLSLNEKAALRRDLESWRGKAFTEQELTGFDVETVIGANCLINLQHKPGREPGKVFANVVSVMPLLKNMKKMQAEAYTREEPPAPVAESDAPVEDEVPF